MPWYLVLLEYLKVLLAWPVLASSAVVLVVWWLRKPLQDYLRNASFRIRTPRGLEIQAHQTDRDAADAEKTEITLDEEQQQQLKGFIENLEQQLTTSKAEKDAVAQVAQEEIRKAWVQARAWEFMYLDRFLVLHTKWILNFIHLSGGQITKGYLASFWPTFKYGDEGELEAVLNALRTNNLLEPAGDMLRVTDKGRAFLSFIGLTPR